MLDALPSKRCFQRRSPYRLAVWDYPCYLFPCSWSYRALSLTCAELQLRMATRQDDGVVMSLSVVFYFYQQSPLVPGLWLPSASVQMGCALGVGWHASGYSCLVVEVVWPAWVPMSADCANCSEIPATVTRRWEAAVSARSSTPLPVSSVHRSSPGGQLGPS